MNPSPAPILGNWSPGRQRLAFSVFVAFAGKARGKLIVIEEIQKAPSLLDEIHHLIEEQGAVFALCGSSARKVRRGRANLKCQEERTSGQALQNLKRIMAQASHPGCVQGGFIQAFQPAVPLLCPEIFSCTRRNASSGAESRLKRCELSPDVTQEKPSIHPMGVV